MTGSFAEKAWSGKNEEAAEAKRKDFGAKPHGQHAGNRHGRRK